MLAAKRPQTCKEVGVRRSLPSSPRSWTQVQVIGRNAGMHGLLRGRAM
jgi:hypothetical protein